MKARTPVSSVILYIFGIIFMIVAGFMLWTAISYTKIYLASYDTTFQEMWSNSTQYIIEKFLPYFAAGVICFGLGKAISVFRKGQVMQGFAAADLDGADAEGAVMRGGQDEVNLRLKELREVGSIKLEELERREKVRLDDMRETVVRDMALHRLQREAKEEEIISKLNAMGEKMGLDMDELYAKADIPVVPEMDEEPVDEDRLGDDPLFEELDKAEEAPAEETEETPVEVEEPEAAEEPEVIEEPEIDEAEETPAEEEEPEVIEETAEEPEPAEAEETPAEEEQPEPTEEPELEEEEETPAEEEEPEVIEEPEIDEAEETPAEEEQPEVIEEPVEEPEPTEAEETPAEEEQPEPTEEPELEEEEETPADEEEPEDDVDHSNDQVLTHRDEPGDPEQVEESRKNFKKKQKKRKKNRNK